jgi:hypothetical protein
MMRFLTRKLASIRDEIDSWGMPCTHGLAG